MENQKHVTVLYATREGHTREVAERVVARLRENGLTATAADARALPDDFALGRAGAAILAASVHAGQHEREMQDFVRSHLEALRAIPTAFLSVTLSQAGVQREDASPEEHAKFVRDVDSMAHKFVEQTGWEPTHLVPVAGALRYSRYNFFVRLIMKRIARQAGGSTDTSRDHDYTDWQALETFVDEFSRALRPSRN